MKTHDVSQGSPEWLALRSGKVTASELDALVSPTFKVRKGDGVQTYLHRKIAEWWQGGPLPSFQGFDMEQGQVLEQEAIPWFSFTFDTAVQRVGFITTDDGRVGCSPDGLLDKCGVEIKCPAAHTHSGYILAGELPEEYGVQVHASMFVTGFQHWKFVSYRRGFPKLVLTIERDEEKMEVIAEALDLFLQKFEEAQARMIEINGGLPNSLKPLTPMPPKPKPAPIQPRPDAKPLHEQELTP